MSPKHQKLQTEKELAKEVHELSKEIEKLKNLEFVKVLKHPFKLMWLSFLKGLMVGFGSVLGASVLVALFVYIVAKISFVPVIGEFVESVMSEIQLPESINYNK